MQQRIMNLHSVKSHRALEIPEDIVALATPGRSSRALLLELWTTWRGIIQTPRESKNQLHSQHRRQRAHAQAFSVRPSTGRLRTRQAPLFQQGIIAFTK